MKLESLIRGKDLEELTRERLRQCEDLTKSVRLKFRDALKDKALPVQDFNNDNAIGVTLKLSDTGAGLDEAKMIAKEMNNAVDNDGRVKIVLRYRNTDIAIFEALYFGIDMSLGD